MRQRGRWVIRVSHQQPYGMYSSNNFPSSSGKWGLLWTEAEGILGRQTKISFCRLLMTCFYDELATTWCRSKLAQTLLLNVLTTHINKNILVHSFFPTPWSVFCADVNTCLVSRADCDPDVCLPVGVASWYVFSSCLQPMFCSNEPQWSCCPYQPHQQLLFLSVHVDIWTLKRL